MIPEPDRAVTMPQNEIAVQIRADNAGLLASPPGGMQGPPVGHAEETCNRDRPVAVPERAMGPESSKCVVDWVRVLGHKRLKSLLTYLRREEGGAQKGTSETSTDYRA